MFLKERGKEGGIEIERERGWEERERKKEKMKEGKKEDFGI